MVLVLLAILAVISVTDIKTLRIPDRLVAAVFLCGILSAVLLPGPQLGERIAGALAVSVPMAALSFFAAGAFGGGDIKLMAAAGFFLGIKGIVTAFVTALLFGGIYCIYLLASGKKDAKGRFPFGPFLCLGIAVAALAGEHIIRWYAGL